MHSAHLSSFFVSETTQRLKRKKKIAIFKQLCKTKKTMFYWNFTNPTKSISLGALLINRLLGFGLFSLVALGFSLIYLFIYFISYLFTYARSFYFHCYYRDFFSIFAWHWTWFSDSQMKCVLPYSLINLLNSFLLLPLSSFPECFAERRKSVRLTMAYFLQIFNRILDFLFVLFCSQSFSWHVFF